ncbi:MAG: insulinase family protein [Phycisphaerae bacterium]|nr:insulinase family protein [Phycisphaerae bacterium]
MQSQFVTHDLPNGLRVVCEVMPRVRSAAVGFLARTGSRHEFPPQHGVSHFLEHMCFKGTATRNWHDINVRFDELGSIYNAFTGKEHTVYYGWVPGARLDEQIELLADMMRPSLPKDDFETERNVILEEIAMSADNFDRIVWNFVHEAVFGEHSLGHEILGEKETIQGLPHELLVDYHRRRYAAANVCLFAAGAVEPEAVFAAAGRYCGQWERAPAGSVPGEEPPPLSSGARKLLLDRFKQQSILLLYPSIPHGHADEESLEAFTGLFGGGNSRCYWNIVQKGICTQAGGVWIAYRDRGVLALFADGEPERCDEMLDALRAQAREVVDHGFRPDEIQRVKNQRRTHLSLEAENPRTRLMHLVDDIETRGYLRTADARLAAVEAVTAESIAKVLERHPITGDGLLLSCGPRDWP